MNINFHFGTNSLQSPTLSYGRLLVYTSTHCYCSHIQHTHTHSIPDELGRVRLRHGAQPGSDYINASFIDVGTHTHTHTHTHTLTHCSDISYLSLSQCVCVCVCVCVVGV